MQMTVKNYYFIFIKFIIILLFVN